MLLHLPLVPQPQPRPPLEVAPSGHLPLRHLVLPPPQLLEPQQEEVCSVRQLPHQVYLEPPPLPVEVCLVLQLRQHPRQVCLVLNRHSPQQ